MLVFESHTNNIVQKLHKYFHTLRLLKKMNNIACKEDVNDNHFIYFLLKVEK